MDEVDFLKCSRSASQLSFTNLFTAELAAPNRGSFLSVYAAACVEYNKDRVYTSRRAHNAEVKHN